jgi:hypothetical protein
MPRCPLQFVQTLEIVREYPVWIDQSAQWLRENVILKQTLSRNPLQSVW